MLALDSFARMHLSNRKIAVPQHVVIANPHQLGDALMTFPLAGALRHRFPQTKIQFAGLPYVEKLVGACEFFDGFIDSRKIVANPHLLCQLEVDVFLNPFPDDQLARAAWRAGVPIRIGNLLRRSAIYCNRFVAYNSTLKGHILDFYGRHLRPLGIDNVRLTHEWFDLHGLTGLQASQANSQSLLDTRRFNLILHPKSGGHGRKWPLRHWLALVQKLHPLGNYHLLLTGTADERPAVISCRPGTSSACTITSAR